MLYPKAKYGFILSVVFLFSCTIEKRLYRNGYYVSSPIEIKNSSKNTYTASPPVSSENRVAARIKTKNDTFVFSHNVPAIYPTKNNYVQVLITDKQEIIFNEYNKPKQPTDKYSANKTQINNEEENKTPKDVKSLLYASGGVLFGSLLYALSSTIQIVFLTNVLFVILPFSIIGLWIFALTLRPKYFFEQEKDGKEKTSEHQKIVSQKRAFLLAGFLGIFGAHRFYLGYTDIGLFQMFTLGGFFVFYFIDMLRIKSGKLKPLNGKYGNDNSLYAQTKQKAEPNKSQKLIKLSLLVSIIALSIFLGFALFFVV